MNQNIGKKKMRKLEKNWDKILKILKKILIFSTFSFNLIFQNYFLFFFSILFFRFFVHNYPPKNTYKSKTKAIGESYTNIPYIDIAFLTYQEV